MHTYVCWYEMESDMVFQIARIPFGDKAACNNLSALSLLTRYNALKRLFEADEDDYIFVNNEEYGIICTMLVEADNERDAIIIFANKLGDTNDRT